VSTVQRLEQAIEAWNRGDLAEYLTLYDDGVVLHGYGPGPMDKAAVTGFYEAIFAGLPGSQIALLDTFAGGDRVAARFAQTGRHDGPLMGVPPTGREVRLDGITILAFRDLLGDARPLIERRGLTLLGIALTNLADAGAVQLALPLEYRQASALDAALDDVRDRYGADAIKRAVLLGRDTGIEVPLLPD